MTELTYAKGGESGASATGMVLASPPLRHRRPMHAVTTRTTTTKGARSMRTTSMCPCAPAAARAARARAAAVDDDRADARGGRCGRRVGGWHGARVAAAGEEEEEKVDDEGQGGQ